MKKILCSRFSLTFPRKTFKCKHKINFFFIFPFFLFFVFAAVKFGRMSKKQREKVEDEVRFHRAQMRAQNDAAPDSSVYDTQTPSSSDQLHHGYNGYVHCRHFSIHMHSKIPTHHRHTLYPHNPHKIFAVYLANASTSRCTIQWDIFIILIFSSFLWCVQLLHKWSWKLWQSIWIFAAIGCNATEYGIRYIGRLCWQYNYIWTKEQYNHRFRFHRTAQ